VEPTPATTVVAGKERVAVGRFTNPCARFTRTRPGKAVELHGQDRPFERVHLCAPFSLWDARCISCASRYHDVMKYAKDTEKAFPEGVTASERPRVRRRGTVDA